MQSNNEQFVMKIIVQSDKNLLTVGSLNCSTTFARFFIVIVPSSRTKLYL